MDKKGLKTIIPDDLTSLESRPNFCFTPTSPGLITAQEVNVTKSVKTSANWKSDLFIIGELILVKPAWLK